MIIVDSSVWIDYFNGTITWQTNFLDKALGQEILGTGDIILTEVLQGFRSHNDFTTAKKLLLGFPCFDMLGKRIAINSAENYRILRKQGMTIRKTIDVIIATFCIDHDFDLLHADKDFNLLEKYLKLKVIRSE